VDYPGSLRVVSVRGGMMMNFLIVLKNMTKQIENRTQQGQTQRTTLNTAKVTLITRKLRQGIRQPLSKTSESKEERAVHKDVTKGPCSSTLVDQFVAQFVVI
jgi:hypothetical protein